MASTSSHRKKPRHDANRERGSGNARRGERREAHEGESGDESRSGKRSADRSVEVELVHARRSHISWMLACLALGLLLLWKLAIIGKIVGVLLLLISAVSGFRFVRTLLNEPGTIRVNRDAVALPLGLCRGRSLDLSVDDLKHAFFLRRAVPWNRAGPILVVEAGDAVLSYPRDWFASDAEQRRVLEALNQRLGRM